MISDRCFAGICFVALDPTAPKFFGFSEFLAALALMVLVWTTTDIRYRFRIATAPVPLYRMTYWVVVGVGSLTLLTDLWRAGGWLVPRGPLLTPASWQAVLGAAFLLAFLTWAWFAHMRPPVFGRRNARRCADFLYATILNGSPGDMATIGREMIRSIPSLIAAVPTPKHRPEAEEDNPADLPEWQGLAHDILLLIADPRFCRSLVASSPGTIHAVFYEMSKTRKYRIPVGQFGRNVVAAAIENRDSFLYHEQDGYASGLLGYMKPLSQAVFGDYRMVEEIGRLLDLDYRAMRRWTETEWNVYTGAVLILLESYVQEDFWNHSFVLYRAFDKIADAADDIYKLDGLDGASWESDSIRRLEVSVEFCDEALKILEAKGPPDHLRLRIRKEHRPYETTIYDHLASLMLKLIQHAESVRQNSDLAWSVRHNSVWARLLGGLGEHGRAARIVEFKLRRKIYDEIITAEEWPNYKNIRLLGFCLHVMGLNIHEGSNFGREYRALHRALLAWTKRNFVELQRRAPQVFEECLPRGMSYDVNGARLVRTYEINAFRSTPQHAYFDLDQPAG
jgi:hypothetical protein